MRRVVIFLLLMVLIAVFPACSRCGGEKAAKQITFTTGFTSIEELAKAYLEAIEKKDPESLSQLMLTPDDLALLQKGAGKQYWQAYFMIAKKSFLEKNKPFLGQKLSFTGVEPGRIVGEKSGIKVYRQTMVHFIGPDGKEGVGEINFIMEAQNKFKIFGLRYISEELKKRGVLKDLGVFDGEAKFKGVDGIKDVDIKVKKTTPPAPDQPAPAEPQKK